jgi:hypothetical protein
MMSSPREKGKTMTDHGDITPIPVGDVWLKFDSPDDEEASHEANTYRVGTGYRIDWYHTGVGQVSSASFPSYAAVEAWYAENGYQDFSS